MITVGSIIPQQVALPQSLPPLLRTKQYTSQNTIGENIFNKVESFACRIIIAMIP